MIDKEKLITLLHILEPFNNGDIPKWAWDVIKDFREEKICTIGNPQDSGKNETTK